MLEINSIFTKKILNAV